MASCVRHRRFTSGRACESCGTSFRGECFAREWSQCSAKPNAPPISSWRSHAVVLLHRTARGSCRHLFLTLNRTKSKGFSGGRLLDIVATVQSLTFAFISARFPTCEVATIVSEPLIRRHCFLLVSFFVKIALILRQLYVSRTSVGRNF